MLESISLMFICIEIIASMILKYIISLTLSSSPLCSHFFIHFSSCSLSTSSMTLLHELRICLIYIILLLLDLLRCARLELKAYFVEIELFPQLFYLVAIISTQPFIYKYPRLLR